MDKTLGKPLTGKEALAAVLDGTGFVTSGGYTFFSNGKPGFFFYFAFGTFPGCCRDGDLSEKQILSRDDWRLLTPLEMIRTHGYSPAQESYDVAYYEYFIAAARDHMDPSINWSVLDQEARRALEAGIDLRDPAVSAPFWDKYIQENLEELTN